MRPATSGGPLARVMRATDWIRVVGGAGALTLTYVFDESGRSQRVTLVLIVGIVIPYASVLAYIRRRTGGSARLFVASVLADLTIVFAFQTQLPSAGATPMFGYLMITTYVAVIGGLVAGLGLAVISVALSAFAREINPASIVTPSSIGIMLIALVAVSLLVEAALRERGLVDNQLVRSHLSSLSHELRTPLTSIEGFTETLWQRWSMLDEDTRRDFVRVIANNAQEMRQLTDALMDFATLEADQEPPVVRVLQLGALVETLLETSAPILQQHPIDVDIPDDLSVVADREAVASIMRNLVINAAKYSDTGSPIQVAAWNEDAWTVISIRDRGRGIPPQELPHVFEPFYRGADHASIPGSGVGLALVRRQVEAHGGRIWVESVVGEGSTFTFTLPSIEQKAGGRSRQAS